MALVKRMAPLRDYLSHQLGITVRIETTNDAREFVRRTDQGRYHFVLTNPVFALQALDGGDFRVLASHRRKLAGYFIVLENSPVKTLDDLAGKRLGAPPKMGFMGQLIEPFLANWQFPGNQPPLVIYFHSHNDAIAALRLGETDASFIVSFMEQHLLAKGLPVRTIHRSSEYPGMTLLSHEKLSQELHQRLQQSLLQLGQSVTGRRILKKISMPGFRLIARDELETVRSFVPNKPIE